MNPRVLAGAAVVVVLGLGLLVVSAPRATEKPEENGSGAESPAAGKTRGTTSSPAEPRPIPAPATAPQPEPAEVAVEEWRRVFPDLELHFCTAEGAPEGRFRAGTTEVLVRDGRVVAAGEAEGSGTVTDRGSALGSLRFEGGGCTWSPLQTRAIQGLVQGGGVHRVAGCPPGEVVETDDQGHFEVDVPLGQACAARIVSDDDGLAMGTVFQVNAGDADPIELSSDLEPIRDQDIERAVATLTTMTRRQIQLAQTELDRLALLEETATTRWLLEVQQERLGFFEDELARLQDPEQRLEAIEDLVFSASN